MKEYRFKVGDLIIEHGDHVHQILELSDSMRHDYVTVKMFSSKHNLSPEKIKDGSWIELFDYKTFLEYNKAKAERDVLSMQKNIEERKALDDITKHEEVPFFKVDDLDISIFPEDTVYISFDFNMDFIYDIEDVVKGGEEFLEMVGVSSKRPNINSYYGKLAIWDKKDDHEYLVDLPYFDSEKSSEDFMNSAVFKELHKRFLENGSKRSVVLRIK